MYVMCLTSTFSSLCSPGSPWLPGSFALLFWLFISAWSRRPLFKGMIWLRLLCSFPYEFIQAGLFFLHLLGRSRYFIEAKAMYLGSRGSSSDVLHTLDQIYIYIFFLRKIKSGPKNITIWKLTNESHFGDQFSLTDDCKILCYVL